MTIRNLFACLTILITASLMNACANTQFTGESITDNILKSDIEKMVQIQFTAKYGNDCRIDSIRTEVINYIPDTKTKKIDRVLELWIASGCGKSASYYINMVSNKSIGGVDFSVSEKH